MRSGREARAPPVIQEPPARARQPSGRARPPGRSLVRLVASASLLAHVQRHQATRPLLLLLQLRIERHLACHDAARRHYWCSTPWRRSERRFVVPGRRVHDDPAGAPPWRRSSGPRSACCRRCATRSAPGRGPTSISTTTSRSITSASWATRCRVQAENEARVALWWWPLGMTVRRGPSRAGVVALLLSGERAHALEHAP